MNQENEAKQTNEAAEIAPFELDFAPSWARAEASVNIKHSREHSPRSDRDRRPERREKPQARPRREDAGQDRQKRGPRRDDERNRRADANASRQGGRPRQGERSRREFIPRLPLEVRVLPEQKALGAIMRRIQTSHCAFPLRDLAMLFLDKPASCILRLEPLKGEDVPLFQCKVCGMPALSEDEIRNHILCTHLGDFFVEEEVECAPPDGQFVCVAKCGLSGEYLGPPNHHSYGVKVREMLRTRYSSMSEEEYRSHIEMIRDQEAIEEWRKQCTRKKVYHRKDKPVSEEESRLEAAPLDRDAAESLMIREIIPANIGRARHLVCSLPIALKTPSRALWQACSHAFNSEKNRPMSLFFALRGAFRHRSLTLFRVNDARGPEFVQFAKPALLDGDKAVPILRDILALINENPGCAKQTLVEKLSGAGTVKGDEIISQLSWLVEKGHVIHFYNDTLSEPADNPYFNVAARSRVKSVSPTDVKPAEMPGAETVETVAVAASAPDETQAAPAKEPESAAQPASEPESATEAETASQDEPRETE